MPYVFYTFCYINSSPKLSNSLNQLILGLWLDLSANKLCSCQRFFIEFRSRWFGWSPPPIDGVVLHPVRSIVRRMLRIIILHEPVPIRINIVNEGYECAIKDADKPLFLHDPLKNTYSRSTFLWYPGPHVDLSRVFGSINMTRKVYK